MSSTVLDASALLALLQLEPGAPIVAAAVTSGAVVCSVNLAEVVAKLRDRGATEAAIQAAIAPLPLTVADFDEQLAFVAGFLRPATRVVGLSLGNRACLALAQSLGVAALTTDRAWATLGLPLTITVIR